MGAVFSQANLLRPAATAADSQTPCIFFVRPAQAVLERSPKSSANDFADKTL